MAVTITEAPVAGVDIRFIGQPVGDAGVRSPVMRLVDIAFDSSYPTGGEAIALNQFGFASVKLVLAEPKGGYVFHADLTDPTAPKLVAYQGDWNNVADAPLNEVPDTTSLATITTRALVFGLR